MKPPTEHKPLTSFSPTIAFSYFTIRSHWSYPSTRKPFMLKLLYSRPPHGFQRQHRHTVEFISPNFQVTVHRFPSFQVQKAPFTTHSHLTSNYLHYSQWFSMPNDIVLKLDVFVNYISREDLLQSPARILRPTTLKIIPIPLKVLNWSPSHGYCRHGSGSLCTHLPED